MKNTTLMILAVALTLVSCSEKSQKVMTEKETVQEKVENRPEWIINEPDKEGDDMLFVGLSNVYASEKGARNDAMRDAINKVVQYLGILAKTKYELAALTYNLDSETMDPTRSSRVYEKQVAANVAKKVKATQWYMEREIDQSGKKGYKYFALAKVPLSSINDAFKQTAAQNMKDAQRRAKEAATEQAKRQAENAKNFWEDMQKQGLVE